MMGESITPVTTNHLCSITLTVPPPPNSVSYHSPQGVSLVTEHGQHTAQRKEILFPGSLMPEFERHFQSSLYTARKYNEHLVMSHLSTRGQIYNSVRSSVKLQEILFTELENF